ncbi:uncharacterized protein [Phaseolus vulgaris]|uniref:uncharacterized protein n=1 Tax=Phaseolus vulgaris TaxID=3885 RepID=UPI0035C97677
MATPEEGQAHEMPTHGEVHTISGGFSGGGPTASQRKKYVRSVSSVAEEFPDDPWESDLVFTRADLRDVVPHDNDPMVISIVIAGRKVHRVLFDQGSSTDVMFWSTFNKLQLSSDLLRPYTGCLYRFADNPMEVRGYLELRTTFTDGAASHTESIRYLVVNANSAYNILLGRPALNRLRAVSSTRHMKMKLPDLSGKVIVIMSDHEEACKCYENSLKTKRGMVMVIERPQVSDSRVELELVQEATPAESTPVEAIPAGATPIEDARTEERYGDASPMEEVYGEASPTDEETKEAMPDASDRATPIEEDSMNESRSENVQSEQPQPVDNMVERQIGGKVFRLGRFLSLEEREEVVAVILRHLDAFAWIAMDMSGINPDFLCHHLTMDAKVRLCDKEGGRQFLGFMLTERGIKANPDKCAAIIAMRSPTSVKEVQQLTGRMAALSRFVSAGGEKGHPYFQCLKRNSRFAWTDECETAFLKLKEYLATPPVLCKPQVSVPLRLYFAVTEWAISSVLVQEQD